MIKPTLSYLFPVMIAAFSCIISSCDNSKNLTNEDVCGEIFKEEQFLSNIGMTVSRTTVLKCDGTFESGISYSQLTEGELGTSDRLTGSWEIEKDIPENVIDAVKEFGLKHDNYSIIKYSSSSGVNGYCLYYKQDSYYILRPLYLNQIPLKNYESSGSLGIWGGLL